MTPQQVTSGILQFFGFFDCGKPKKTRNGLLSLVWLVRWHLNPAELRMKIQNYVKNLLEEWCFVVVQFQSYILGFKETFFIPKLKLYSQADGPIFGKVQGICLCWNSQNFFIHILLRKFKYCNHVLSQNNQT